MLKALPLSLNQFHTAKIMHLIIYTHPNIDSFNHAILDSVQQVSIDNKVNTVVRDLYALNFNPILNYSELQNTFHRTIAPDVLIEQDFWLNAKLITLIYPLWWMGFPAMLKGYLDRVLSYNFAYKNENGNSIGLLQGKKLQQFITIGNKYEEYEQRGYLKSLDDTLISGLFNFCGMSDTNHTIFADIHRISQQKRIDFINIAKKVTFTNLKTTKLVV